MKTLGAIGKPTAIAAESTPQKCTCSTRNRKVISENGLTDQFIYYLVLINIGEL